MATAKRSYDEGKRGYGDGGITGRDGKFQAQIRLPDGRRPSKTFATRREATSWIAEQRVDAERGVSVNAGRETVGAFLARWLAGREGSVRPNTHINYAVAVRNHLIPALGALPLAKLTPDRITAAYAAMRAAGVGAAALHNAHVVLRAAGRQAVAWGLLARDPAALVARPKLATREMTPLSRDEARRALAQAADDDWEPFVHLCLLAGLRCGEALGVKWADIDWRAGTVAVRRQVVRLPGVADAALADVKSASARRTVPLAPATLTALRAHRDRQAWRRKRVGAAWVETDLVTTTGIGTAVTTSDARGEWRKLRRDAGLPAGVRLHDLRHTFATHLLANGENVRVVQALLGHATPAITLGIYAHVLPGMAPAATARLAALFGADADGDADAEPAAVAD